MQAHPLPRIDARTAVTAQVFSVVSSCASAFQLHPPQVSITRWLTPPVSNLWHSSMQVQALLCIEGLLELEAMDYARLNAGSGRMSLINTAV
jgi:hypothetical protein